MAVLVVNNEPIDASLMRSETVRIRQNLLEQRPDASELEIQLQAREWAREILIGRVLLRQAADQYWASHPSGDLKPEERIDNFLASLTREVSRPARRQVSQFYESNRERFRSPESVHAAHIVKNVDEQNSEAYALSAIQGAEGELRRGRPFEAVADQYSDCPGLGGDLGWFTRGEMVDEFDAVVFRLRPGEISSIFRTQFGFHIAKLHARRPEGIRPLSEVYAAIEEQLFTASRQRVIEAFIGDLRAKADVRTRA